MRVWRRAGGILEGRVIFGDPTIQILTPLTAWLRLEFPPSGIT